MAHGKSFFRAGLATVMLDDYVRHLAEKEVDRYDSLSEGEREIFQLTVEGRSKRRSPKSSV